MRRDPGLPQISDHDPIDRPRGEGGRVRPGAREEPVCSGPVRGPRPEGLPEIRGKVKDAVHLPLAVVDPQRALGEVEVPPPQAADLGDAQAAAQHEEEDEAVPDRVDGLEEGHQVLLGHRLGQRQGGEDSVAVAPDRLPA